MSGLSTVQAATSVHVVVPEGVDDPARPSGGNSYDLRICGGLADLGWVVHQHAVPGSWPRPDPAARAELAAVVSGIPDAAVVLIDGLIASTAPEVLVPEADRLRLTLLVHMPLGNGGSGGNVAEERLRERTVLSAAVAVFTTSGWTRRWLLDTYDLLPGRVHVAEPGVDSADLAPGTAAGGELLCVAAVAPHKGHDVLFKALGALTDLPWHCVCAGSLGRDSAFVDSLTRRAKEGGFDDRVQFAGACVGADLDAAYAAADLLVLASHAETYGMVVAEALARGLPVVATEVGGLPETLGDAADGCRPGVLVPPGDSAALAAALRDWLADSGLRQRLRQAARSRRTALSDWSVTSVRVSRVLAEVAQ
jgi:glycosyltransferase involved in cell wall biosynthesis